MRLQMKTLVLGKKKFGLFRKNPNIFVIIIITVAVLLKNGVSTTKYGLNGMHFNYVGFHNPPFETMIRGPNSTFIYSGSSIDTIKWLAEKFNFTVSFIPVNEILVKQLGTHEAAFFQLKNDENIDGITPCFYLTMDRVKRFDFTSFIWCEEYNLVLPRPGEESRLFAFIRPFQPMVWVSILISILVIVSTMKFFTLFYVRYDSNNLGIQFADTENVSQDDEVKGNLIKSSYITSIGFHMIYVINIMTNQGGREAFSRTSFRILSGVWVLCAMVLVNSYTGIVTSSLTTPKLKRSVDSFEDLATSKEVEIVIRSDTPIGSQILGASSGIYKVLGDQVRSHPDRIFVDPFKLNAKLETGHFAYPFLHTFTVAFVSSQYKKEGKCRFKVSKSLPVSTGYYSLLYKKGTWYTNIISEGLLDLYESGLVRFGVNRLPTIPRADECFSKQTRQVSRRVPIQLTDLTSAFIILGIGIGMATLTFLLELIYITWN